MHYSISDTAEYGDLHAVGPRVVDEHVRENMRKACSATIQDGVVRAGVDRRDGRGRPSLVEARREARGRRRSSRSASGCATLHARESAERRMASVDVPVALLGYGTVGSAVNRLLNEQADDIERATGHRLRVVKALVRDVDKERGVPAGRRRADDRRRARSSTTRRSRSSPR